MATLYELETEYRYLYDLLSQGEIDEQTFNDSIEGAMLNERIEEKAEGYAQIIRSLEADKDAVKAEAKRLSDRATAYENNAKRLRERLQEAMVSTKRTNFKTLLFSFAIQNNPKSVSIADDAVIPKDYLRITESPDRTAIKAALEKGITVPGCVLTQSTSLRIR